MKVYGTADRMQLENKSSDYATTIKGLIWFNTTTGKVMLDDGATIRALLRNDQKAIIGNSGTASQNIRLQRGAAGVLQFVTGDDVTAEGTLSTTLNQLSSRVENYTNAGKPAFGNAGRLIWVTDNVEFQVDTGAAWVSVPVAALDGAVDIRNLSFATSIGANALTIALKDKSLADPSGTSPIKIAFRNSTLTTGNYVVRTLSGASSIVVASGATLGLTSAVAQYIYIYALDNSGTIELAVAGSRTFDEGVVQSTTIMNSSSDSSSVLYSTTARTNVPIRLIGRLAINLTVAGTYDSSPTSVSMITSNTDKQERSEAFLTTTTSDETGSVDTKIRYFSVTSSNTGSAFSISNTTTNGSVITINEDGIYSITYIDSVGIAAETTGISKNSTFLTTSILDANNDPFRISVTAISTVGAWTSQSVTLNLKTGDKIRPHTNSTDKPDVQSIVCSFRIVKITD